MQANKWNLLQQQNLQELEPEPEHQKRGGKGVTPQKAEGSKKWPS